ncbi:GNAT family N-acetyltransferase [Salininema proteolyticum]|uniref:GNAT family N-acetyltransferase n=1 Tax=Salininema proteolyticum TaxID=1607685 RepID=A0ABV8TSL9_9ACTN
MQDFTIVPLDVARADHITGIADLHNAVSAHRLRAWPETSPIEQLADRFFAGEFAKHLEWVALSGDRIVGHVHGWLPVQDNTHLAEVFLLVHPDHRRRGIGTALLEKFEKEAAAEGRETAMGWTPTSLPDGERFDESGARFCEARGFEVSNVQIQRRVDLASVDEEALDGVWAEAWERAGDYELIEYDGLPPEDALDGLALLSTRMFTDMPLGDTDLRPAEFTGERIRREALAEKRKGTVAVGAAVRHKPTGEIAGRTKIAVQPGAPDVVVQGMTIVLSDHRGHRLGAILKIANQRRLKRNFPGVKQVMTWNAESNEHMIAINEAVGYRPLVRDLEVQKKLG